MIRDSVVSIEIPPSVLSNELNKDLHPPSVLKADQVRTAVIEQIPSVALCISKQKNIQIPTTRRPVHIAENGPNRIVINTTKQ
jgi:hypothetical protein